MSVFKAIGLMSGTSLDGLDIVYAEFKKENDKWQFDIIHCETKDYDDRWKSRLRDAHLSGDESLELLNKEYGEFLGNAVKRFIEKNKIKPQLIASHGHTVFHDPANGITVQTGDGREIAKITETTVVYDFRSEDVRLGGQGAPLVPIGDKLLFGEYEACVNLGGFANISVDENGIRKAWDICPVNFVLNALARRLGKDYDDDGLLAQKGKIDKKLLNRLNSLEYYSLPAPKSLGREWVEKNIEPLLADSKLPVEDLLRTFTEHSALKIAGSMKGIDGKVLFTGGGTYNDFLMKTISRYTKAETVIPSQKIIDYKEALIFALMGVLRLENKINILGSVTGSGQDITAGRIAEP
jgi:anhydro-N-acetylmuramic acid kinase